MTEFTFPDSGVKIEIERVSYVMVSMVEEALRETISGKPMPPYKEVKTGDTTTQKIEIPLDPKYHTDLLARQNVRPEEREIYQKDFDEVNAYLKANREWERKVSNAYSKKMRLLYAKRLRSELDKKAIKAAIADAKELGVDLEAQVLKEYADAEVPFDKELLPHWIYLWCVCCKSVADISAINSWMSTGSKEAVEATRRSLAMF